MFCSMHIREFHAHWVFFSICKTGRISIEFILNSVKRLIFFSPSVGLVLVSELLV